jgi:hypothetical protein
MVFPDGPVDQLERDGATVQIEELQSLDIESVVEPEQLDYAQPDTGP